MKIIYSPRAVADLHAIADYLQPLNPHALQKVKATILDSIRHVAQFPNIGRRLNRKGVRRHLVPKYDYAIFYLHDESAEEIRIVTIRHTARRPLY